MIARAMGKKEGEKETKRFSVTMIVDFLTIVCLPQSY
jgi:hypothetical protein